MQEKQQQHPFLFHEGKKRSDERYESWDRMNHAWRAQNYRANNYAASTISPPRSPTRTAHRASQYRSLSPASRTQAIASGQRELMEMVKNMPEACYELSLKDLVEQSHRREQQEEEEEEEEERNDMSSETDLLERPRRTASAAARNDGVRTVARGNGGSSGRGHMLKVVFPVSLASSNNKKKKKKKKTEMPPKTGDCEPTAGSALRGVDGNNKNDYNTAKVSPRPSGGVDKEEWWRKRYSAAAAEGESDGLSSSTGSGGSKSSTTSGSRSDTNNNARNRSGGGGGGGCWWFILGNKKSTDVE